MKIDPQHYIDRNELVGGYYDHDASGGLVSPRHKGGIPLRLEIAARVLAGSMQGSMIGLVDCSQQVAKNAVEYALIWADALIAAHNATAEPKPRADGFTDIVFDGPPSHESGRFVEVEDHNGRSVRVGKWVQKGTSWRLRLPVAASTLVAARDTHNATAGEVAE